jgi:RHH-type proline utilization regulon transcriptional repressor/proline dehydrogenase/delta 1-pyrroline-5-carboxylate dehydrogenase
MTTIDRNPRSPAAAASPPAAALRDPLRLAIAALTRAPEPALLPGLLDQARLNGTQAGAAHALALRLAHAVRERTRDTGRAGLVQSLLQEFALSSQEGVALMCLAEALLRIPDAATRDALIRDKLGAGDWQSHLGRSPSLFVNAATWGLLITGRLVATHSDSGLTAALRRIVGRGGEPLIRRGVDMAMRLMGEQFVTGQTIDEALANARPRERQGFRYSFDMLGEAALTAADAARYLAAYEGAIDAIGAAAKGRGVVAGPGISIKLSALHPRYVRAQRGRVSDELYPRLRALAQRAQAHDIGLNIDAEESERLELSLDLLERLAFEPALAGWQGLGFVVQAYGKRCPAVIDWLVDLGRRSGRRLMVRLVKGAYWDSEVKRAQEGGQDGYPVYTRKAHTDVAYLACARALLAASDAVYPQFATHNAQSLAAIHTLAGGDAAPADRYEFQCLHGMGEPLYEQVVRPLAAGGLGRPCRVYAPVGTHETLLAYLVRRLLENGANTSFVNRIADPTLPLETLVEDPVHTVEAAAAGDGVPGAPHPAIPLPRDLYGGAGAAPAARTNSRGLDLADEATLAALAAAMDAPTRWQATPLLATEAHPEAVRPVRNPADRDDLVGHVSDASAADVEAALAAASAAASRWAATPPAERAAMLARAADALEAAMPSLLPLLAREAGKTAANGVAEVREAVDFLRFYAAQVAGWDGAAHVPLGPLVCISPWNFPLAIFTGQVAAALAAGNPVLAKPAEQTPLVAAEAVRLLHAAGVPRDVLQLLPGRGETVGAALVADARVQGVLFTGSTEVARLIQRRLAERLDAHGRPVTLVAETGGQNAMVVDSSALAEQAVADVLASAFDSAGQRCSALRVLCLQADAAERVQAMLEGAMRELRVGDPRQLATDVGPVIDDDARTTIERHVEAMRARGRRVVQPARVDDGAAARGGFVPPTLIEIERLDELGREVFGPVLHVLRYDRDRLDALIGQVNASGYALTFGVHTRIDETVTQVASSVRAGNVYVNRHMVGAVVGVQPFGGEGLSGTGPKAGGPLTLLRLLARRPDDAARAAIDAFGAAPAGALRGVAPAVLPGAAAGTGATVAAGAAAASASAALQRWAEAGARAPLAAACVRFATVSPAGRVRLLAGPTGEANLYATQPREAVLCLAADGEAGDADRLLQLAAVLAVGSRAVWPASAQALAARLPDAVRERIVPVQDWTRATAHVDIALVHAPVDGLRDAAMRLAARPGALVVVVGAAPGEADLLLERLVVERALSVNTAAAGGNASLMTIG